MKKQIFILVSLVFLSCGSRKVDKSKTEIKKDSISIVDVQTNVQTNVQVEESNISKIDTTEDEFIIEPIDSSKEITVNGKTYKNVKIRHKKTKVNSLYTNKKKVVKNDLKQQIKHNKQVVSTNKLIVEKKVYKKESIAKYFYILFILIILYIIYKYRSNILKFLISF